MSFCENSYLIVVNIFFPAKTQILRIHMDSIPSHTAKREAENMRSLLTIKEIST